MRLLLIPIFIIWSAIGFSQESEIDSLTLILNTKVQDTIRLNTYNQIVNFYSKNNIQLAEKYLDTLLNLAKVKKLKKHELTGGSQKGILSFRKGEFSQGIDIWKKTLSDEEIDNFPIQKGNLFNNIAVGYKVLRDSDSVVHYMHKSIDLNENSKNTEGLIANYYSISDFYNTINVNDSSVIYLNKLQKIALKYNDNVALARAYILLANISRKEYDFEDAIIQFNKALKIYNEIDRDNIIMRRGLEFEIINTNIRAKKYKTAIRQISNLKENYFNGEYDDFWTITDVYLLGCYNKTENYEDGLIIYNRLINSKNTESFKTNIFLFINVSDYELRANTQNQNTLKRLHNALEIASNKKDTESKQQIHKLLSDYWIKNNNYKNAYSNLIDSNILLDSLNNDIVLKTNLSLKRKFNEEVKDKENLQLEAKNVEQKLLTASANSRNRILGLGLLILGISAFFIWRRYKAEAKAKQIISYQKDEIEQQKNRVETLQKELHHRMKNNLSFIDLFINLAKGHFEDKAYQNKLNELQNRIRSMFEVHKQLFKKDDVTSVQAKNYIDTLVENVKQAYEKDHVTITNTTNETETLLANTSFPVGLIVNEFITNSYKYAFEDDENGQIIIALTSDKKQYQLSLKDNGKGLPKEFNINDLDSFGLETIQLLTKEYGGTFTIDGTSGVSMNITLPKNAA